jgi:hypothetical protein
MRAQESPFFCQPIAFDPPTAPFARTGTGGPSGIVLGLRVVHHLLVVTAYGGGDPIGFGGSADELPAKPVQCQIRVPGF